MGGRKLDNLKKFGDKLKVVSDGIEMLPATNYLIWVISDMEYFEIDPNKPLEATV